MRRFIAGLCVMFSAYFMGCMAYPVDVVTDESPSSEAVTEEVEEASEALTACGPGLCCSLSDWSGSSECQNGSQVAHCCPSGYGSVGSSCLPYCPGGRSCGWSRVTGAGACTQGCNGSMLFCCPAGKEYSTAGCR